MGVPASEDGYTAAIFRGEDREVPQGHVVALDKKKIMPYRTYTYIQVQHSTETYQRQPLLISNNLKSSLFFHLTRILTKTV